MATPIFSISQNRNPAAAATADPPSSSCRAPARHPGRPRPARHTAPTRCSPAALRDQPGDGRAQQPRRGLRRDDPQGETCGRFTLKAWRFLTDSVLNGRILYPICKPGASCRVRNKSRCAPWSIVVGHGARSRLLAASLRIIRWLPGHFDRTLCVRFAAGVAGTRGAVRPEVFTSRLTAPDRQSQLVPPSIQCPCVCCAPCSPPCSRPR